MAPVTIETTAQNSYYSAGNIGWSARSLFAYRTAIQQLASNSTAAFGNATTTYAIAQSFTPGANLDVNEIRIAMRKVLAPTDNLSLSIYSDTGASVPNASLAVADNVYNGAALSTTVDSWISYQFATPVSLTSGTKYWIVIERSGAADASNYYRLIAQGSNPYAGGGAATLDTGTTWSAESATTDAAFQILTETPSALYTIVQDTSGLKLRAYKSTDGGGTWNEQDSANAPAVTNANYPYSACDTRSGPYIGTARFTNTNIVRVCLFNMATDTWGTDLGAADATTDASNERSIRVTLDNVFTTATCGSQMVNYSTAADDADLHHTRRTTTTWATGQTLAINSTEASLFADSVVDKAPANGGVHRFYYDVVNDDFSLRSFFNNTLGTEVDLSIAAADVETEHASATYQIYQNGSNVDTIVAAFIDAGGTLQERILNLEVPSASVTMAADNAVDTATTTAGRQLSTARYDGTNYIAVNVSGTGIAYYESTVAGTWGSAVTHLSGLTACTLSQIASIPGVGLAVVYTDNGTAKFDIIVAAAGGGETGTATVGTASAAGGSHTATAVVTETGTATVGTAPAAGGSHTGTAGAGATGTATVGTASAAGGSHTATAIANQTGTATVGTAPAAGGSHTGSYVAHQTGTHASSDAAAAGGSHTATAIANYTGTHTASNAAAAGGSHVGSAATVGTGTVGTASATGGTHTGDASVVLDETGTATVGTASAAGGSHSANVANTGTSTVGTASAAGGDHSATAGIGTTGTTTAGTASAAGGAHTGTAATIGTHTSSDAAATGHAATGTAGTEATGTATVGDATATGGTHTGSFVANLTGTATVGTATAEGGEHSGFSAAADVGSHIRGQATAEGGTHTGVVTASASATVGTASAQGGAHEAQAATTGQHTTGDATATGGSHSGAYVTNGLATVGEASAAGGTHTGNFGTSVNATGTTTTGTATAAGGSHVGSAGATGSAVSGSADAAGASHTATASTTGVHVVGTAVAIGHDATTTIDYAGAVIVGTADASGGDHTGTAATTGLAIVGEATATGGTHTAEDGAIIGDLDFRLMVSMPLTYRTTVQRTLTFRQTEARAVELALTGDYDG